MTSSFNITVKEDFSLAYVSFGLPAAGETKPTYADVENAFRNAGVRVSLDETTIRAALDSGFFNTNITGAIKKSPVDGENGRIDFKFPPTVEIAPIKVEGQADTVDYKNLGFVRNIRAGTVIAQIFEETEGAPGEDVRGTVLHQVPGKPAKVTIGKGTALTEDGKSIVASFDGNLKWEKSYFTIDEILTIPGDVDASTGNIDFLGDIVVRGNILENFTVKSDKNIVVNGSVNNCTVFAQGELEVKLGAVNATVESRGNMKIGFCEQAKITCGGDVSSNSFVACTVFCEGELQSLNGKGVVVGGKLTCIAGMQVKLLGSENYTKTRVTLGNAAILAEEKLNVEGEITALQEKVKQLVKVENLLSTQKRQAGGLPPDRESMYRSAVRDKLRLYNDIKKLQKRISDIDILIQQNQDLAVIVKGTVYPGVSIRIGSEKIKLETPYSRTKIYVDDTGVISFRPLV
ncbi:polymerase [Clostridia bacterium]|nr:polymerase [Clostridia bacterium]